MRVDQRLVDDLVAVTQIFYSNDAFLRLEPPSQVAVLARGFEVVLDAQAKKEAKP